ncbi:MAG: restriction endonuclease subunit S [Fibrobacteria bacterium]|nr:restriction endonuclease subunit S [Fibrobacteria bacterium]
MTNWKDRKLGTLGSKTGPIIKAGPFGSSLKKEFYVKKGYKIYGQEQVISEDPSFGDYYVNEKKFNELKSCAVAPGDILISLVGTFGKMLLLPEKIHPGIINPRLLRIRANKEKLRPIYLKYFLESFETQKQLKRMSQGGTMGVINAEILKSLSILFPPLPEQKKITEILSTWDRAIEKLDVLIKAKKRLKKGLMQQLLTGKMQFKEFKGSGKYKKTKLGMIPKEWGSCTFGMLGDKKIRWSITGGPFGSDLKTNDFTEKGVRIIQLQNIGDGEFKADYKIYTSEEKADSLVACNIYADEIILSKMGDPVGRACLMPGEDERYLMASDGIRLVPDKKIFDKYFVLEFINFILFRKLVIRHSTGSTRQRIGLADLKKLPFIMPPLHEQKKIWATLETLTKTISTLVQEIKLTKTQKKGLMQQLFTGKIRIKTP